VNDLTLGESLFESAIELKAKNAKIAALEKRVGDLVESLQRNFVDDWECEVIHQSLMDSEYKDVTIITVECGKCAYCKAVKLITLSKALTESKSTGGEGE